ncbi:MAG TPA: oxidoreductase [Pseudothermotoga sp.]
MENFSLTVKKTFEVTRDSFIITFNEKIDFAPTQFIMIETPSVVRKPFALGKWFDDLAIGIQVIGKGTQYIVKQDVLLAHGPLGKGFVPPSGKGAMITTPACLAMAFDLHQRYSCDVFIGSLERLQMEISFRTVIGNEEFVNLLKSLNGYDWFYVVGSDQMEKVAFNLLREKAPVYLSFNEYMACGIGACRGCAIQTKEGIKHVCIDGPVFRGDLVWN